MATITITAQYSYQAWQQAHNALRSNVQAVDSTQDADSVTITFASTTAERWPVAARHYREVVAYQHRLARAARLQGDRAAAAVHLTRARESRIRLSDAKTGMVTPMA